MLYLHKQKEAPSDDPSPLVFPQWLFPLQSLSGQKTKKTNKSDKFVNIFVEARQDKSIFTSGSSSSRSGVSSVLRRSLIASLYISIAENFKTNALSSCCNNKNCYI